MAALAMSDQAMKAAGLKGRHPKNYGSHYTEAQVWGKVPLDSKSVKEVRIAIRAAGWPQTHEFAEFARGRGIAVKFIHSDGRVANDNEVPRPMPEKKGFFRRLFGGVENGEIIGCSGSESGPDCVTEGRQALPSNAI
jgi:hypothetical protein